MISWACAFGEDAGGEIPLEVDIEECRCPAERHGRAVLFLHTGQVPEVQPLNRFLRGARRARDVEPVARRHLHQLLERADLLGELLPIADHVVGRQGGIQIALLFLFALDEPVHAVERDATIVADDAAATVRVGQSRQNV